MPIGQVYRSPVPPINRVSVISSPFLELDAKQGALIKRNFVVKKKPVDSNEETNGSESPKIQTKKVKIVKKVKVKHKNKENADPTEDHAEQLPSNNQINDQHNNDDSVIVGSEELVNGHTENGIESSPEGDRLLQNGIENQMSDISESVGDLHINGYDNEESDIATNEEIECLAPAKDRINVMEPDPQMNKTSLEENKPELTSEKISDIYEKFHAKDDDDVITPTASEPHIQKIEIPPPKSVITHKPLPYSIADHAKGLKNLGNTCFMNSIIQCLAHSAPILALCQEFALDKVQKVATVGPHTNIKIRSDAKTEGRITSAFANLVKDMWTSNGRDPIGSPQEFKREIGQYASKFLGFEQHDSQELLQYALEGMHSEINRIPPKEKATKNVDAGADENNNSCEPKKYDPDDPEEPNLSASEVGRRWWRQYLKHDSSVLSDLFMGQFRSTLKCTVCSHESVTFEPFWLISVPIPSKGRPRGSNSEGTVKLQDCLDLYVAEESLDGNEKPTCGKCKERQKCVKWYMVERWPKILVIHLKRFAPGERFRSKLSNHVDVPVEYLDLSSYSKSGPAHFDLYGVSNHSGTLHGGHYTAYCRHPYKKDKWHLYNDRAVSSTSKSGVISYEAYLLFFERKENEIEEEIEMASAKLDIPIETNNHPTLQNGNVAAKDDEVTDEDDLEDGDEEW
ncbi:hypothetical protein TCAL_05760 [Tigriopus californicus]|uniref:Ubiquitin carboxyl-terminal hydrolase n=1 Tax=Tigriopus californicus TaxID=6832 RepID=A0A553NF52_TIGCA|nr:ubiquitin carboxyl-terminal hydrolase 15-like [Tigriopus californicus]TRY64028.1 hypothetical protein TCAL_05760 [Tigriopus californicus]|eukprot:TCALIF_05760-PA protein Name:"Similar to USP2 Ubiquitin carboxyl-terminal hydrolase 2 (Gallus gallus)" AED:0.05 eAED:0.05 QI:232/1/1/1/1/1/4/77/682